MAFPIERSLLWGSFQVPSLLLLNTWNQQKLVQSEVVKQFALLFLSFGCRNNKNNNKWDWKHKELLAPKTSAVCAQEMFCQRQSLSAFGMPSNAKCVPCLVMSPWQELQLCLAFQKGQICQSKCIAIVAVLLQLLGTNAVPTPVCWLTLKCEQKLVSCPTKTLGPGTPHVPKPTHSKSLFSIFVLCTQSMFQGDKTPISGCSRLSIYIFQRVLGTISLHNALRQNTFWILVGFVFGISWIMDRID